MGTVTKASLDDFCGHSNVEVSAPFAHGKYLYATDGSTPRVASAEEGLFYVFDDGAGFIAPIANDD